MADNIYIVDFTEPEPLEQVESIANPYDEPYLWRVELLLMSKFAPEFVEATVFKIRSAALERAKIVKEHHVIINSMSELQQAIENDLATYAKWSPPSRMGKIGDMRKAPRPGIGREYQEQL
jgi:hypothetical protein